MQGDGITRLRGARKSSPLARARAPWVGNLLKDVVPPDNWTCPRVTDYSIAGNDQYGDCVSAEEPNHLKAYSLACNVAEVRVSDQACIDFARKHGFLHGADLSEVMDAMMEDGMKDSAGVYRKIGPYHAVDYTNQVEVKAALFTFKTLNIAVSANQLENVHTGKDGWFLTGGYKDGGIDHCVGLHGYGSLQSLAEHLGVSVPSKVDGAGFGVLLYTWGSVGIVDWKSLQGIMYDSEAWARNPGDTLIPLPPPTPPAPKWPEVTGELFTDNAQPIRGTVTLKAAGETGEFPYIVQRDAVSGKYALTPKVL